MYCVFAIRKINTNRLLISMKTSSRARRNRLTYLGGDLQLREEKNIKILCRPTHNKRQNFKIHLNNNLSLPDKILEIFSGDTISHFPFFGV